MADPGAVLDDLVVEGAQLEALVAGLEPQQWAQPTPAQGWTVAHQIAHLTWTDAMGVLAATDAAAFRVEQQNAWSDPGGFVDKGAEAGAQLAPQVLLTQWRQGRVALDIALRKHPAGAKLPWFGPPMSVTSMATARLMETWAHGMDIADTLGRTPEPTERLRHIAYLGVRTRDYAYSVQGIPAPTTEFRVELTAPDSTMWAWGPVDAEQRVSGPALDFCLLVTQRRHPGDLALTAIGADARHWLTIAQTFAGPPGSGRSAIRS